jgi:hypothetical protein
VFQRLKETVQRWVLLKIVTVAAGARPFVETKHQCILLRQENTGLPSGLFPPGFAIRILYAILNHLGLIILITLITKLAIMNAQIYSSEPSHTVASSLVFDLVPKDVLNGP